jgi:hypothetical protein
MDGDPISVNDFIARQYASQMIDEFRRDPDSAWRHATRDEIEGAILPVFYNREHIAGWAYGGINTRYDLAHKLAQLAEDNDLIARLDEVPLSRRCSRR